jgi:uncharacterized protein
MSQAADSLAPRARANRLASTTSPYLLQHQYNPVEWFPWGDEAFAEARRRDVPVFLSIGYSTCYWCHVMERECFESQSIAALMNEHFVCVKVDREERPDVDDVYMAAVQAFSGRGGWPMSVFLEPARLQPFFAGTYFPATPRYAGMPSFPDVLLGMSAAWREKRDEVLTQALELGDGVRERLAEHEAPSHIDERQVSVAVSSLLQTHDAARGGFGPAPKFPQPAYLELLLDARSAAGDPETRSAIDAATRRTLDAMALGGMFDQLGGGFHRYSVDDQWLVPHFEKMLYDNAQLASLYARAGQVYDDPFYLDIARATCAYVQREMLAPEGGFWSAQDAEVDAREGLNYLWTRDDLAAAVPDWTPADIERLLQLFGLAAGPNFRDPHHPGDKPTNVLFLAERPSESDRALIARARRVLLPVRDTRRQPATDDKLLAGWNGMMIAALCKVSDAIDDRNLIALASRAAELITSRLMTPAPGGTGLPSLKRCMSRGKVSVDAFLEDYAFCAQGLLALHRCTGEGQWLRAAEGLLLAAEARFSDELGGYFDTRADQPDLFVRTRSAYDGAIPSGTSAIIHAWLDLDDATGRDAARMRAARGLASISGFLARAPLGAANSARALLRLLRRDRACLDRALRDVRAPSPAAGSAAPGPDADPDFTPVEVLAAESTVELPPSEPAVLELRMRIAPGYHLAAAQPGTGPSAAGLVPFKVHIINGSGVAAFADYPEGSSFAASDDAADPIRVYEGDFELTVVLERAGEWKGRPLLAITYQACTASACLRPRTVELDVAIDRL